MSDAEIIQFPGARDVGTDELLTDADAEALREYIEGEYIEDVEPEPVEGEVIEDDDPVFDEPGEFLPVDGEWVFMPATDNPVSEVPVGMVAHRVTTMCKWQHRHLSEGLREPQQCCYSVLVTTARLPGPVRTERSWLAEVRDDG